jgi:hypothetical protein
VTFLELYGTYLDTELGTSDRTQRFTTALRKMYVNEGQREFNNHVKCYVRRFPISLVDDTQEYNIEGASVITNGDYLWPSKTTATLKRVGTTTLYTEGPDLKFKTEEELNQDRPNWRAESAGTPECWTLRSDAGAQYVVLVPAPDIPVGETWTLLWPYVAQPADMTDDTHEPYGNASPRTSLRPYHRALLHYAAAQCEKLRKNWDGVKRQMELFGGYIAKYEKDNKPPTGSTIRISTNWRPRAGMTRPLDPTRWP